ncbi:MAG: metallophosphoesterase family protein [Desulfobacca sp.]|uniref:metallophosphoesterase family protein n=1 Tax=Desulfobacca sp. TaxID=2067990 RepID=UPI004049C73F
MLAEGVLALISDTHLYRAGLPLFFQFLARHGVDRLACLGDCEAEPFLRWLQSPGKRELYWVHDVYWPDLPEATAHGLSVALAGRLFLAHTRATAVVTFRREIAAYKQAPPSGRSPLLICHGHTHTPSVSQFGPSLNQILYINSTARHAAQLRQEVLRLAADAVYLIVPGAFTYEEGRFPNLNFALLDTAGQSVEMVTLPRPEYLHTLTSLLPTLQGRGAPPGLKS